jgi:hypothetical protein
MMLHTNPIPHQKTEGAVAVRADVYPANVTFSFGVNPYPRSRAIITADTVMVLVEGGSGGSGASVLYEGRLEDYSGDRTRLVATTADGEITVTRQSGCGCGSRLRSYRPFGRAVRMATVPA